MKSNGTTFQHLVDYTLGYEKKQEVSAKSREALERMGHRDLKLNEHESPSPPMRLNTSRDTHPCLYSCHRF